MRWLITAFDVVLSIVFARMALTVWPARIAYWHTAIAWWEETTQHWVTGYPDPMLVIESRASKAEAEKGLRQARFGRALAWIASGLFAIAAICFLIGAFA